MMTLAELERQAQIDKLIIHSLEYGLYQVIVNIDGSETVITDNKGRPLREFSVTNCFARLRHVQSDCPTVMRHGSAYDEMVGQPVGHGNQLEVPLHDHHLY